MMPRFVHCSWERARVAHIDKDRGGLRSIAVLSCLLLITPMMACGGCQRAGVRSAPLADDSFDHWVSVAEQSAEAITDSFEKGLLLDLLVDVLVAADKMDRAGQVVSKHQMEPQRLAWAELERGNIDAAALSEDSHIRYAVARAMAELSRDREARELASRASTDARATVEDVIRIRTATTRPALWKEALAKIELGESEVAMYVSRAITATPSSASVDGIEAALDWFEAPSSRAEVLEALATASLRLGDASKSRMLAGLWKDAADKIQDPNARSREYYSIARRETAAGWPDEAMRFLRRAQALRADEPHERDRYLLAIQEMQTLLVMKRIADARELLQGQLSRSVTGASMVAVALAMTGDRRAVAEWLNTLSSPEHKGGAAVGLANWEMERRRCR